MFYGKIIRESTIYAVLSEVVLRDEDSRQSYRCPYGCRESSLSKNNPCSCINIGRSDGEWDKEVRETFSFEDIVEVLLDFIPLQESLLHIRIEELHPGYICDDRLHLMRIFPQGIECPDDGTHTRSSDSSGPEIHLFESTDHTDMGKSPSGSSAQCEGKHKFDI